ncbi:hypothetical protein GHT09_019805 [Marmota monax]|uniref:Uncharacterized protein n=1 Tax=Marmota monax TaxID=9995 RepID=A0A834UIW8_MARMO|nr:hypothetical protein GHT09_019805 [Marmota monax]
MALLLSLAPSGDGCPLLHSCPSQAQEGGEFYLFLFDLDELGSAFYWGRDTQPSSKPPTSGLIADSIQAKLESAIRLTDPGLLFPFPVLQWQNEYVDIRTLCPALTCFLEAGLLPGQGSKGKLNLK